MRKILSIATLLLVVFVVWQAQEEVFEAINYLANANLWLILLLIPEQLLMYYCVGQMMFSYLTGKQKLDSANEQRTSKMSPWTLARISFELNFFNQVIPSGGATGLVYITWRLKKFGISAGQTSFMYILRYWITIAANQVQVLIAVAFLCALSLVPDDAWWVIGLALLMSLGIVLALLAIVLIAGSRQRIDWFVRVGTQTMDAVVKAVTFGRRKKALDRQVVENYFYDLHDNLTIARRDKRLLIRPALWGWLFSFLEVATYWLVATSMGHPEIILQFMVAEAVASAVAAAMPTPSGVGGYEGAMILVVATLGVEVGLATAVVVSTRVAVLVGTIISGYGFYQHTIKDRP